eukprot:2431985-Amphidinium_carterae.1
MRSGNKITRRNPRRAALPLDVIAFEYSTVPAKDAGLRMPHYKGAVTIAHRGRRSKQSKRSEP